MATDEETKADANGSDKPTNEDEQRTAGESTASAERPLAAAPSEATVEAPRAEAEAPKAEAEAPKAEAEAPAAEAAAPAAKAEAPATEAEAPSAEAGATAAKAEAPPAAEAEASAAKAEASTAAGKAEPAEGDRPEVPEDLPLPGYTTSPLPEDGAEPTKASDGEGAAEAKDGQKKRRRRRRKRKGGAEGDGQAGGEGGDGEEPRRKGKERERPAFGTGDEVFGKVSQVTESAIWVDIAGKAIGLCDRAGVKGDVPAEGDQFIAKVYSYSTRGGMVLLGTEEPTKASDARAKVREALEKGEPVDGWVMGVIKGGVEVDLQGLRAFAPASHVDLRHNIDLSYLLGQKLPFVITSYGKKGRDIVVSRRKMVEEQVQKEREEQLGRIEPGTVCRGVVRNVLNWGAFVALPEFANIEGVVHMTEASHDRGARLTEVFKPGTEIDVKVLRIDEKGKLWLSHKAMQADPWDTVKDKYPTGSQHEGKVVRLTDFGAFIQLEPGVDGLCHISDLSLQPIEHPSDAVETGASIQVIVAHLDAKAQKISLHPAPSADEMDGKTKLRHRVKQGEIVRAEVVQIRDAGLAVRILGVTGRGQRAFVPSGQTGTPRGTDLRKSFPIGHSFDAKVLDVDPRKGDARLSIRAVKEDAERKAYKDYRKQVQKESSFGTFADLLKKS